MITLTDLSKRYGSETALHPLSLSLKSGARLAVIGPSGCGKSTLLRLLMGLIRPSSGTLSILGEKVAPDNLEGGGWRRLRQRIGYVIQDGGLFPHLSARANITLMAEHLGWKQSDMDARVTALTQLTNLTDDLLARRPGDLSGGQRQRVAIMRALMLKPDLLLLDEPLSALDPITRAHLAKDLDIITRDLGITTVLVTHSLGEARLLGDHILLLKEGQAEHYGPYQSLIDTPATDYVRLFLAAEQTLA